MNKATRRELVRIRRQVRDSVLEQMESASLSDWRRELKDAISMALQDAAGEVEMLVDDLAAERLAEMEAEEDDERAA